MASQSAPSSAAMDVAVAGEEVIMSMFQRQCNGSFYAGWPVILLSKKDTSLGLFPGLLDRA